MVQRSPSSQGLVQCSYQAGTISTRNLECSDVETETVLLAFWNHTWSGKRRHPRFEVAQFPQLYKGYLAIFHVDYHK